MSVVLEHLIREAVARLASAGVRNPEAEAEQLAALALGVSRGQLRSDVNGGQVAAEFVELVRKRASRLPLERIVGRAPIRGIELVIGDGVFAPQPESEPVVEWCVDALARMRVKRPRVVDLCTGSGAIALAIANEVPRAEVHAVELDPKAFQWARRNADLRAAAGDSPTTLHLGDIRDALRELDGGFDIVVSNPPYVADHELAGLRPEVKDHDPRCAVQGGRDGLDLVRVVERTARRLLKDGGLIVVEHSDRQGRSAPAVFEQAPGWIDVEDHVDQDGLDRFVTAQWRPTAS